MRYLLSFIFIVFLNSSFAMELSSEIIEHQIRLCDTEDQILQKLNLSLSDFKKRKVYYFETIDQYYKSNGWSLRLRLKENKIELDVKRKLLTNSPEPQLKDLSCEFDLHGTSLEKTCKIQSELDSNLFQKFLKKDISWEDLLSPSQLKWLKDEKALLKDTLMFGTLENFRTVIWDKGLGEITLDLVTLDKSKNVTYHEISTRYFFKSKNSLSKEFEALIDQFQLKKCLNQIDWEVNKFDVLKPL